ncbi:hypothetical protein RM844_31750 [Streptomyces sp. DSM 44915]|uniref:Uncharacterized protein n=1 Tax=Streptomyces chisholmiae TaxID=3075540 RepID=A0ABU2K1J5_9ACTN|nr:hypothetical protein [Streptomyces sp. DSM 44915]MDT0270853.1 hypothetical protein [Streptomyces sp. DSM 44915]
MRMLSGSEPAGALLVLSVVEHAGRRPAGELVVDADQGAVMDATGALWLVDADQVARVLALTCPCRCTELTNYRDGAETSRSVTPGR